MPGARAITVRPNGDALVNNLVDMSFDSNKNLQKIARIVNNPGQTVINHGLIYPPEFLVMTEVAANKTVTVREVYNWAGTFPWYCPSGVSEITVKLWGGGGAGGGLTTNSVAGSGGGGAGGQYASSVVEVTPGETYYIKIGAGGAGSTGNGTAGGDSTFEATVVVAKGGAGGLAYQNGGTKGSGSLTGGVGDTVYKGGNGGVLHTVSGHNVLSEGGGGAGPGGDGGNAPASEFPNPGGAGQGGVSWDPDGEFYTGDGAPGIYVSTDGFEGNAPGGGGGGGGNTSTSYTTDRSGGAGGGGWGEITYTRDLGNSRYLGNNRTHYGSVDDTNVYIPSGDTTNLWVYEFLDPVKVPTANAPRVKKNYPCFKIYNTTNHNDYASEINSYFDSFKIFKTGTLTITTAAKDIEIGGDLEDITTVTVDHNLGYIPMFAPFVDTPISINMYKDWLAQYYNRNDWTTGVDYFLNEVVNDYDSGDAFECKKSNTASSENKPNTGANWTTFWTKTFDAPAPWVTAHAYVAGNYASVHHNFDGYEHWGLYKCILNHTSGAASKPGEGASWETYWEEASTELWDAQGLGTNYNLHLNDMEDIKVVYGGVEVFDEYTIEYYATTTQLVFKLTRSAFDWRVPEVPNGPLMATTVTVDYTIFYNKADEEISYL